MAHNGSGNDEAWGDIFAAMAGNNIKSEVVSRSNDQQPQRISISSSNIASSQVKRKKSKKRKLQAGQKNCDRLSKSAKMNAITGFLRSRGEDVGCLRHTLLRLSSNTHNEEEKMNIISSFMPGWRLGKPFAKITSNASEENRSLLLTRRLTYATSVPNDDDNSNMNLLLQVFRLQRNIRALAFAVVYFGLKKKTRNKNDSKRQENHSMEVYNTEKSISGECVIVARQCSMALASTIRNTILGDDTLSLLREKAQLLLHCTQKWHSKCRKFNHKSSYSLCSLLEYRTKVIMAADDIFYRLYYEQLLILTDICLSPEQNDWKVDEVKWEQSENETRIIVIPHPHVYFSLPGISCDWPTHLHEEVAPAAAERGLPPFLDPLVMLHEFRMLETKLHFHSTGWNSTHDAVKGHWEAVKKHIADGNPRESLHEKRQSMTTDQWLDWNETPAHPIIVDWRNSIRDFPTHLYAYATLPGDSYRRILRVVRDHTTLVSSDQCKKINDPQFIELGSGTGYFAHCMSKSGCTISAYDSLPLPFVLDDRDITCPRDSSGKLCPASQIKKRPRNEYHGSTPAFFPIQFGSTVSLASDLDNFASERNILVLSYPPPGENMGELAIRAYLTHGKASDVADESKIVIHIGEFVGTTGSTGLERLLLTNFVCLDRWDCLHWGTDSASCVTIWKHRQGKTLCKQSGNCVSKSLLVPCINCKVKEGAKRCIFARDVVYCSYDCFYSHTSKRNELLEHKYMLKIVETGSACGEEIDFYSVKNFQTIR